MEGRKNAKSGMVVAPHRLAASAGSRVLAEGGNAIEAAIAAAATIVVLYPHMNSLGGDNFILIGDGRRPIAIDACGRAALLANNHFYKSQGINQIPERGPLSALTVAGAVSGWQQALSISRKRGGKMPLGRLLEEAVFYGKKGALVSGTLHRNTKSTLDQLKDVSGFSDVFLSNGLPAKEGTNFKLPSLANTFERLALAGLNDFYIGDVAQTLVTDLIAAGSPLRAEDFQRHEAEIIEPLSIKLKSGRVYTTPPPTQGLASLIILGLFDRLNCTGPDGFSHVHSLVEATKHAFSIRDKYISDPDYMKISPDYFLQNKFLDGLLKKINPKEALQWPMPIRNGDTVWVGAIDEEGCSVSLIQSIYWEFGSGVILPQTGIVWQNRGTSFSLNSGNPNFLTPGKKPFHTIHPAMALLNDGRLLVYGTMGGEGQPQTQAALFTRYVNFSQSLQKAISAPRWLLGRTWGDETPRLRLENRFKPSVVSALELAGHDIEIVGDFDEIMGHAGAVVRDRNGNFQGASDPRCDGAALAP